MPKTQMVCKTAHFSDKLYFSIGEVGSFFAIKPHVLRYWETAFPQLTPIRRHKRRYYRQADIKLIGKIKTLLYEQGFTIEGARLQLTQASRDIVDRLTEILRELEHPLETDRDQ